MGNLNPTFGRLIDFDFASRVTGIEITENVEDPESLLFENKEYSRNVTSLGSGTFDGSNGLPGLSAFEKPNPRNRNIFFAPTKFRSPAVVEPARKVKKPPALDTIVSPLLLSPGEIGVVHCGGKIRSGQNLQACVTPVIPR